MNKDVYLNSAEGIW